MNFDMAIIGSGFGGSLLAMIARRLDLTVLLLEKGRHPRFAIGESTSPLANLLLETLADRYDLPALRSLSTYGSWQRDFPQIGCGLKRGFTFFRQVEGQKFDAGEHRKNQLMVAASPNDEVADTHWLRADVDEFLMREAVKYGAAYRENVNLDAPKWDENGVILTGNFDGEVRVKWLFDATGPNGFLAKALKIPSANFDDYPETQALYTHFDGVKPCAEIDEYQSLTQTATPPYPMDAAAVHHIFDGGWMWILRFDNGQTSAGIAVNDMRAREWKLSDGAAAWKNF